jgi:hypothetical protein
VLISLHGERRLLCDFCDTLTFGVVDFHCGGEAMIRAGSL